jgi:FMN phosphatase YigB (HAD superfamily)
MADVAVLLPGTRAVFFDVDFTLIYPGPTFQGSGYRDFCARYGIAVDPALFDSAVKSASTLLATDGGVYDPQIFIEYTSRIIQAMGGAGPEIDRASRDIYDEWSLCQHFLLYDDVADVLRVLRATGLKIGLISNTQRCLASFQSHFALDGIFDVAISSSDHGFMKPNPSRWGTASRTTSWVRADWACGPCSCRARDVTKTVLRTCR